MADRCTNRGGPLHEGTVHDGCITCPWHESTFDGRGRVVSGPATRPQPTLAVRIENGRIQVRRDEQRTLRLNPVGH
jgi:nitrite reductase/ring-hydroxylating ferredoxin subunit